MKTTLTIAVVACLAGSAQAGPRKKAPAAAGSGPAVELAGEVTATGGLVPKDAERVLRQYLDQIRGCAARAPVPAATVKLDLDVDASGAVTSMGTGPMLEEGWAPMFDCLMLRSADWKFPAPKTAPAKVYFAVVLK